MKKIYVNGVQASGLYYNGQRYSFSGPQRNNAIMTSNKEGVTRAYTTATVTQGSQETSGYKHTISVNPSTKFNLYSVSNLGKKLTEVPSGYKFVFLNGTSETISGLSLVYDGDGLFHISGNVTREYYTTSKLSINSYASSGIFLLDSNDNCFLSTNISSNNPFSDSTASSSTTITYNTSSISYGSTYSINGNNYKGLSFPYKIETTESPSADTYYIVCSKPYTASSSISTNYVYIKDYTLLSYIQSDGNQYINTGVNPTSKTNFEIDFMYLGTSYVGWTCLYGERGSSTNTYLGMFINTSSPSANSPYISPNYSDFDPGVNSGTTISKNTRYKFKVEGGNMYINGSYSSNCSTSQSLTSSTVPICLLAVNTTTGVQNRNISARLYECKIYEGQNLVRLLVPAKRNSDNEIGMYDTVNNVFYTNQGTGSFTTA